MRSLLPLRRLERLHRLPDVRRRRRGTPGWIASLAYPFDGSTQLGVGTAGVPPYPTGVTWLAHCTYPVGAGDHLGALRSTTTSEFLAGPRQWNTVADLQARYRDEPGTSDETVVLSGVDGTEDSAGFYLVAHTVDSAGRVSVRVVSPSGLADSGKTAGAGDLGDSLVDYVLAAWTAAGGNNAATTVAQCGIIPAEASDADLIALYDDGRAHDWRPIAAARSLSLPHYWRMEFAYDDGSVKIPDDGTDGTVPLVITAGDVGDLVSTVPTGVA